MKTIHDFAASVGISKDDTDEILNWIKSNSALLASCTKPHDFSLVTERRSPYKVIENPDTGQLFSGKRKCSKCGGIVDNTAKYWYDLGVKDSTK